MAGDWIKLEHATLDKPEVIQLASILEIDQDAALGKCLRVWAWFDENSIDGTVSEVTVAFIDRITHCAGFGDAMRAVGWLEEFFITPTGGGGQPGRISHTLVMPHFDYHLSQAAKRRAVTQRRTAASRAGNAASVTDICVEAATGGESASRVGNAAGVTKTAPEREREREKEKNTPSPLISVSKYPADAEEVQDYCDKRGFENVTGAEFFSWYAGPELDEADRWTTNAGKKIKSWQRALGKWNRENGKPKNNGTTYKRQDKQAAETELRTKKLQHYVGLD